MTTSKTQNIAINPRMTTRSPIVVVLGHVDHGKSSLLEAIREDFKITSKESGGITQHIGAYVAEFNGKKITFIDTPGHEAFSAMRSRGARIADIAILVVAADEGVQPQTKEAIQVIKDAKIPFIVAINKVDKPEADVEKIKSELAKAEVYVESFGGTVPFVETSTKTKQGIKDLLELILLMAELENLQTDEEKPGEGIIIESYIDQQRGPAVTLLALNGKVKIGNVIGTKSCVGKAHIIEDFQGQALEEIIPSMPALVVGFEKSPRIGEEFKVFANEEEARTNLSLEVPSFGEGIFTAKIEPEGKENKKTLNLILKADVAGSLEVLQSVLETLPQEQALLKIVSAGIGEINETDMRRAQGIKGEVKVIGFRAKANKTAEDFARRENIAIEHFDIIYDLIQNVREAMEKLVQEIEPQRKDLGSLRVLAIFFTEKNRKIIGGRVLEGEAQKGANIEVMRKEVLAGHGKVLNLQKDKKEAQTVKAGEECGISYEGDVQVEAGDILKFYVYG